MISNKQKTTENFDTLQCSA